MPQSPPTAQTVPQREVLPQLEIYPPRTQQRWTVLLRLVLVIPQGIAMHVLTIAAEAVTFVGWFGALGTGRLPRFAEEFLTGWLKYYVRVLAYAGMLVEDYPPFDLMPPQSYPVQVELPPGGQLNRAAVFFRFVLVIPAAIVSAVLAVGWYVLAFFFWLAVLIQGRTPQPVFACTAAVLRYLMRAMAYYVMLTPAYPKGLFGDGDSALPPAPPPSYPQQPQGAYNPPPYGPPPPNQVGYPPPYGAPPGPQQPPSLQKPPYGQQPPFGQQAPFGQQPPYGSAPGWQPQPGYAAAPMPMAPPAPQGPSASRPLNLSGGGRGLLVADIILGVVGYFGWIVALIVLAATGHLGGGMSYSYGYGYGYGGTYHHYQSGGSDQQQVAETINDYYHAFAADNGAAACSHLTSSRRRHLVIRSGATDCPAAVHTAQERLSPGQRSHLAHEDILLSNIVVNGDRATWTNIEGDSAVLERVGGTWQIDRFES